MYTDLIRNKIKESKESIKRYNLHPKICPKCLSQLSYAKRCRIYCSIKCANTAINKGKKKDLNLIKWDDIQRDHDGGLLWSKISIKYGFSNKILLRAEKIGLISKIRRYHTWTAKEKKAHSKKRKKYLSDNPKNYPWKKHTKFKSVPCEILKEKLRQNKIEFVEEYKAIEYRHFSIDIAFPDKKIGIEVNGNQHYHRDGTFKEYYQDRNKELELNHWKIFNIHYSKIYDDKFICDFIQKIKQDYSLDDVDYSFYIKSPKMIVRKYGTRKDYNNAKNAMYAKDSEPLIKMVLDSDTDFSKFGWVKNVAKIIGKKEQKVNEWMKKFMLGFYNEKCFKRKDRHGKSRHRKYGDKNAYYNIKRNKGKELMAKRIKMLMSIKIDFSKKDCYLEIMDIFNVARGAASKIVKVGRIKSGLK